VIFLAHAGLAAYTCDSSWLQRSGSMVVAIGLLLESWQILTTPSCDDMAFWRTPEVHSAVRASVIIIIIGTLLQGYADIPFRLFVHCG